MIRTIDPFSTDGTIWNHFFNNEPAVNGDGFIQSTDAGKMVHIDMPGVKKEDVKVDVAEGTLKISGERKHPNTKRYYRSFRLGRDMSADDITASLADGVLTVFVPYSAKTLTKKTIEIK